MRPSQKTTLVLPQGDLKQEGAKILFTRPITQELIVDIDFLAVNPKSESDIETFFLWCKEGWQRSALEEFHSQKQTLSRFFLGAMIVSDPVVEMVRRELRRVSPDVKIDLDQIRSILVNEVIKREVMITRALGKSLRAAANKESDSKTGSSEAQAPSQIVSSEIPEPPTTSV